MKNLFFTFFMICGSLINPACGEKNNTDENPNTNENPISKLQNAYLMPIELKNNVGVKPKGFFMGEKGFSGYDGCNTFHGEYEYHPEKGFKIKKMITTERKCNAEHQPFNAYTLAGKTFDIKDAGDKYMDLVLYDKDKKETNRLFFLKPIKNNHLLGSWKLIQTDIVGLDLVKKENREPVVTFSKNNTFLINYNKDKTQKINYFEGTFNANEIELLFFTTAEATASTMSNGEDSEIAYPLKSPKHWEIKDKKLTIKTNDNFFIFEKI